MGNMTMTINFWIFSAITGKFEQVSKEIISGISKKCTDDTRVWYMDRLLAGSLPFPCDAITFE